MPAQSVHQARTLAHQPLPATVQQHRYLLVSRLDRHKAHRRAPNRLADRFRIGGIMLVALDVRLHVLRRHQSHLVAKRAQLPPPVVRRRARLQANQTGRQLTEERQNLRTPKLLAQNRRSLCINPVHLKNMLRQVQSDRSNLAHGWLPFAAVSIRQQFGTQMPQGGHPPHHSITSSAVPRSVGGTSRPSALAVLRLITSSYLVGACTGRSPGFSPFRTRSTYDAARRNRSILLAPYDIRPPSAVKKRRWYMIGRRCRIAERKIRARLTKFVGVGRFTTPAFGSRAKASMTPSMSSELRMPVGMTLSHREDGRSAMVRRKFGQT